VGHRQKVFDPAEGMIRQRDRAQANYRKSETLPPTGGATLIWEYSYFLELDRKRELHPPDCGGYSNSALVGAEMQILLRL